MPRVMFSIQVKDERRALCANYHSNQSQPPHQAPTSPFPSPYLEAAVDELEVGPPRGLLLPAPPHDLGHGGVGVDGHGEAPARQHAVGHHGVREALPGQGARHHLVEAHPEGEGVRLLAACIGQVR